MARRWVWVLLALAGCAGEPSWTAPPRRADGEGARPDSPGEAMRHHALRRVPAGSEAVPVEAWRHAADTMARMPHYSTRGARFIEAARAKSAPRWEALGPGNVSGRTRTFVFDPRDPNRMIAGGVSGGLWESTDAGANWRLLGDDTANINIGALLLDPADPDTIYAGTGELYRNNARPFAAMWGQGILRSTDGGATFQPLLATQNDDFRYVSDLVASAHVPGRLYAATHTGIWRSDDRGARFVPVLRPADASGGPRYEGCTDLLLLPDPAVDRLLASCSSRSVDDRYWLPGTVTPPACGAAPCPAAIFLNEDAGGAGIWREVLSEPGMGRTSMDLAASRPGTVYAVSASVAPGFDRTGDGGGDYENGLHAVWRSADGGRTWEARLRNDTADALSSYLLSYADGFDAVVCNFDSRPSVYGAGWYNQAIAVDPRDADVVWVAGMEHYRSDDGGRTFGKASYWWYFPGSPFGVHADQHLLRFHPRYDGTGERRLFSANDGGIAVSENPRAPTVRGRQAACGPREDGVRWRDVSRGMGTVQFYTGAVSADGRRWLGGAQDNGTLLADLGDGPLGWRHIYGGDGASVMIDPRDPDLLYASAQGVSLGRSHDGGLSFVDATAGLFDVTVFIMPILMDPTDPDRLWAGGSRLWRSDDQGRAWRPASERFGTGFLARVSALAVSPANEDRVLVGNQQAIHWNHAATASTGGTTWHAVSPRAGWVSSLRFDPVDPDVAYATYSTFGGEHVWRSGDGGRSWTAIDGSGKGRLPDIPVHSLVVDPGDRRRLYIGTDLGVFVSLDGGAHWAVENTGFAQVITETLAIAPGDAATPPQLFAFTYGRGAWRVPLADLDAVADHAIGPEISGSWFDPAQDGQGWVFESVVSDGVHRVLAAWYTFDGGEPMWLVGSGVPEGDRVRLALASARGGDFPPTFDPASVTLEPWGEAELRLRDADRGDVQWTPSRPGFAPGRMPLARLTAIAGEARDGALNACHSGSWFDAARPGHGLSLEVVGTADAPQLAVVWYAFRDGAPQWFTGIGPIVGDHADVAMTAARGAAFPPAFDPAAVVREPWGTLRFTVQGPDRARLAWSSVLPGYDSGELDLARLAGLRGHDCR